MEGLGVQEIGCFDRVSRRMMRVPCWRKKGEGQQVQEEEEEKGGVRTALAVVVVVVVVAMVVFAILRRRWGIGGKAHVSMPSMPNTWHGFS